MAQGSRSILLAGTPYRLENHTFHVLLWCRFWTVVPRDNVLRSVLNSMKFIYFEYSLRKVTEKLKG